MSGRPTVASFWVLRDAEYPAARERNYPGQLRLLQRSCDRLGLRHIVLTDHETAASAEWPAGIEPWATDRPRPLMRAVTEVQARYLENRPATDTLFVGADCIILKDPAEHYPEGPGMCLTYRGIDAKYPVNTGTLLVRRHSLGRVARIYRRAADRCQKYWCADQAALQDALRPLPVEFGTYERRGVEVAFMPMHPFNVRPADVDDPCDGVVILHFRGKRWKAGMFQWAARHGFS